MCCVVLCCVCWDDVYNILYTIRIMNKPLPSWKTIEW